VLFRSSRQNPARARRPSPPVRDKTRSLREIQTHQASPLASPAYGFFPCAAIVLADTSSNQRQSKMATQYRNAQIFISLNSFASFRHSGGPLRPSFRETIPSGKTQTIRALINFLQQLAVTWPPRIERIHISHKPRAAAKTLWSLVIQVQRIAKFIRIGKPSAGVHHRHVLFRKQFVQLALILFPCPGVIKSVHVPRRQRHSTNTTRSCRPPPRE